jgi:hypothetical protein
MENTKQRQICQVMTRVNGWLVSKDSSNPGKQAEYADRVMYSYDIALEHQFNC